MVVSIGVNERDGGTLYNTQLLFDADGTLIQRRRKITPTYHERMIWGQGDGSGLRAVDSAVGRIGQLACWEHYNPLARYALMADGEQIHSAMYPGSFVGAAVRRADGGQHPPARPRIRLLRRQRDGVARCRSAGPDHEGHRLRRSGRSPAAASPRSSNPDGQIIGEPLKAGEGEVIADLDFALIDCRKTADGLARPLQPPRTAQPADRPHARVARPRAHRASDDRRSARV